MGTTFGIQLKVLPISELELTNRDMWISMNYSMKQSILLSSRRSSRKVQLLAKSK